MTAGRQGDGGAAPGGRRLILVNNLLHDIATGIWLGAVVVSAGLALRMRGLAPAVADVVAGVRSELAWVIAGALMWVVGSGLVRLLFYSEEERLLYPAAGSAYLLTKRTTVLVKHGVVALLLLGTALVVFVV